MARTILAWDISRTSGKPRHVHGGPQQYLDEADYVRVVDEYEIGLGGRTGWRARVRMLKHQARLGEEVVYYIPRVVFPRAQWYAQATIHTNVYLSSSFASTMSPSPRHRNPTDPKAVGTSWPCRLILIGWSSERWGPGLSR